MIINFNNLGGGGSGSGSTVSWNQIVTGGTQIARITIDGVGKNVYAPEGGQGGGLEVVEYEDIDTAKGLEIYEHPEKYLLKRNISSATPTIDDFFVCSSKSSSAVTFNCVDVANAGVKNNVREAHIFIHSDGTKAYGDTVYKAYTVDYIDDNYTPTSGFTTINGSAITEGGDIQIQGGGDSGLEVVDYDSMDYLKGREIYANPEKYIIIKDDYAYSYVGKQVGTHNQIFSSLMKPWNGNIQLKQVSITSQGAKGSTSEFSLYNTFEIDSLLSGYTPTTGFATINGSAITEGGDIQIQGGGESNYVIVNSLDEIDEPYDGLRAYVKASEGEMTPVFKLTDVYEDFGSDTTVARYQNDSECGSFTFTRIYYDPYDEGEGTRIWQDLINDGQWHYKDFEECGFYIDYKTDGDILYVKKERLDLISGWLNPVDGTVEEVEIPIGEPTSAATYLYENGQWNEEQKGGGGDSHYVIVEEISDIENPYSGLMATGWWNDIFGLYIRTDSDWHPIHTWGER